MAARRVPTTEDAIRVMNRLGLSFDTVVDVGVHEGTPKLMRPLPRARHILIEPSPAHVPEIRKAYAGMDYVLHQVAVGDEDAEAFIADTAIDGSQTVTHSRIVTTQAEAEALDGLLKVHDLSVRRLDTLLVSEDLSGTVLLKIDVDGHELPVLRGALETLGKVVAVTIEAPRMALVERAAFLSDQGFELYDIVDLDYYDDVLWQVDLVFLRRDIMNAQPALNPIPGGGEGFRPEAYRSFDHSPKRDKADKPWTSRFWRKLRGRR